GGPPFRWAGPTGLEAQVWGATTKTGGARAARPIVPQRGRLCARQRAQRRLVDLADRVLGQLREHLDLRRPFVLGEPAGAEAVELLDGDRGAGALRDIGDDDLAEYVVGPPDDRGLEDALVGVQRGLDLLGVDVLAAA